VVLLVDYSVTLVVGKCIVVVKKTLEIGGQENLPDSNVVLVVYFRRQEQT
jgi:hypothetical protein